MALLPLSIAGEPKNTTSGIQPLVGQAVNSTVGKATTIFVGPTPWTVTPLVLVAVSVTKNVPLVM